MTAHKIRVLPEKVASQIAAGEVIDRPASVVRELLDNSVDAGADRITVSIENGGKRFIKVSDNGMGMSRDDLLLSLERYATSKITTTSDLFSVRSLGFRGEALPSIASVSKMEMTTRLHDQIVGHRLRVSGGKLVTIEEAGTPAGTVVNVRDLFFNVPARRKFLRANKTETDHIADVVSRIALPFPKIHIRLNDGERILFDFPVSKAYVSRLSVLLGKQVAESMTHIEEKANGFTIRAFLAPSDFNRMKGDRLFVYVNNRNVRDRLVNKAILEGYGQRLMKGNYPQAVLFIEIDSSLVDVNVHPTKQEVRFRNSNDVFRAVVSIIEKAFSNIPHTFPYLGDFFETKKPDRYQEPAYASEPLWDYSKGPQATQILERPQAVEVSRVEGSPLVIGQLDNTYILCEVKDGLLLVDQHAAHERIVYETLKKDFFDSHIEVQTLLVPQELEFSMRDKGIIEEKVMQLARLGIELEHFGGNTFLLRSHPAILKNVRWDSFVSELISELSEGVLDEDKLLDKVMKLMACHGAIRAGSRMNHEEMNYLLQQLEKMALPTNCPHGRPIFIKFTIREIEKMFKRIV